MSVDLESLAVFVRVAELRSFTAAAEQLGMPRARASAHVQRLEAALGAQLLQRSTRVVRSTPEGEALLGRARTLIAEADEIASLFRSGRTLRGRVRVGLPVAVARDVVIPRLPELLERHPLLHLDLGASDRMEAAMRDGFDVVLRVGPVSEPALVGRRLGEIPVINAASPSYLRAHGTPRGIEALREHTLVHYAADPTPVFEYRVGEVYEELPMRSAVTVDSFEAYEAAAVAGLGIVQVPGHAGTRHDGALVPILPDLVARPVPISLLHTHGRSAPARVRVVLRWLADVLVPLVQQVTRPGGSPQTP